MLTVKTNNQPRDIVYGYELPADVLSDFDYLEGDALPDAEFVKYKGQWYHLGDVESPHGLPEDSPLRRWDCFVGESFFSAVVFKFTDNFERVICGHAFS